MMNDMRTPSTARQAPTLPHAIQGPPYVLPKGVDGLARRWVGLPPRLRFVLIVSVIIGGLLVSQARILRAESRWGGSPIAVLVATQDAGVGEVPHLDRVQLPPGAVPDTAVTEVPPGGRLSAALPEGAVLTQMHISPAGPAVALPAGARLVPVPVDEGWAIATGGYVDVWIQLSDLQDPALVATGRPVLDVRTDESGDQTALVSIQAENVTDLTAGLANGSVLLSHAPTAPTNG